VELAGVVSGERVLDVGCGTGNLTLALRAAKAVPTGIDLSAPCVEYARRRLGDPAVRLGVGDALHLPYPDGAFDRTLSMLALDVMPDPQRALAEMRRVTHPGGTIAALVPDVRSGLTPITMLWDTAAVLDPRAGALRDELMSAALGWSGGLVALFHRTALTEVKEAWTNPVNVTATVVALTHPCLWHRCVVWRQYGVLQGREAELQMLHDAITFSGLRRLYHKPEARVPSSRVTVQRAAKRVPVVGA
jgi:SAM-dependent methyltransferase